MKKRRPWGEAQWLSVRAERVIANLLATSIILLTCSCSVTNIKQINIDIDMKNKKQKYQSFPNTREYKQGVKMDSVSKTIQSDSMSIKDMIRNHIQGTLDPTELKDGQYDGENVDHDTNVEFRQQTTLIDALDYANENKMSQEQIQDYVDTFGTPADLDVETEQEALKTPLNESEQNAPTDGE